MGNPGLYRALLTALAGLGSVGCIVEDREFDPDLLDAGKTRDDSGDSGSANPNSSSEPSALCEEYCSAAMANCVDEYAIYASEAACLALCAHLPPGKDSEEDGSNTVACRLSQARFARSTGEPEVHCPSAGPGGNDRGTGLGCGSNCESYCMLQPAICAALEEEPVFETEECLRRCAGLPNETTFDVERHHDGDNVQCRLVHLSSAAIDSRAAETHCWHSRITPREASPCGNPPESTPQCEQYCDLVMVSCSEELAVYDSRKDCLAACETFTPGTSEDTVENTLGCRRYHAYSALDAPKVHCSHAGPSGDGHCGKDNCESYCPLLKSACADDYAATFEDDDACLSACAELAGADKDQNYTVDPAPTGNNVQCRIYHAVRAFSDDQECAAALGEGDCK